jgi:glyoxylase-like metal-dependent hydrolase (beta-lactamase superfamily II)
MNSAVSIGAPPGSIPLVYRGSDRPHIFTGDSLFPGGPGKTDGPAEFGSLMDDLEERVFGELPDDTWVFYPGQGTTPLSGGSAPASRNGAPAAGDQAGGRA